MNSHNSLGSRALSGFLWSAVRRFGDLGLKFLVGIILARLLDPSEFGLVAMVTVFVALGAGIADAGFGSAIIQKQELSQRDLSSVFYFNVFMAAVIAVVIYIGAPIVATFYDQPQLVDLLRVLCLSILLGALGSIHQSQLLKRLAFRRIMLASIPSLLLSGGLAITLAYMGWGVWSLVAQAVTQAGLFSTFLWMTSTWRPTAEFSWASICSFFPFGSRLAVSGLINTAYQNIYVLVIGRVFSATDLAYYQRAHEFKRMGAQNLSGIAESVMFPLYSSIQDDRERIKRVFGRSVFLLSLLSFPLMGMMAGLAEPLIAVLLGAKWLPSVPYLQWLCLAGALYPIHAANLSILKALGQSRLFLRLEVVKKITALGILAGTYRFGIMAIIYGQVLQSLLALAINSYYNRKLIDLSCWEQLGACLGPITLAIIVFTGSVMITNIYRDNYLPNLVVGMLFALAASGGFIALMRTRLQPEIDLLAARAPWFMQFLQK